MLTYNSLNDKIYVIYLKPFSISMIEYFGYIFNWKGSGDRVPFHLGKSGSAHSALQMSIYGSGDRVLFYSIL